MKHLLISILFFSLFFSSCEKGFDYDCTDCTFFYCEVDGEEWTPNCNTGTIGFGCSAIDVNYYPYGSKDLYIYIRNEDKNERVQIFSKYINIENRDYPLILNENFASRFINLNKSDHCLKYEISSSSSKSLFISEIDTINFLVAGTFAFTGFNDCGDEVDITNGKFRLNYTF